MSQLLGERALLVSSDGHATARMREYVPYVDPGVRGEFLEFCDVFDREGMTTVDPKSLANRIDPELVQEWVDTVIETGRLAGQYDPVARLKELDREGIAGEVLFPDFGLPWELHPPLVAAILGYKRTPAQVEVANRAYNRWLVDILPRLAAGQHRRHHHRRRRHAGQCRRAGPGRDRPRGRFGVPATACGRAR
jgi:hypothetical protein